MPSASHRRSCFPLAFPTDFSFGPSATVGFPEAAFLALLDVPPLVAFADSKWPLSGVLGREVSGVDVGVASVEGAALLGLFLPESKPGMGGGGSSDSSSGLVFRFSSFLVIWGVLWDASAELSSSLTC